MKVTVHKFIFLALVMVAFNHVSAQKASYTTNGGMTIGFGLGASYQGSDIKNSIGGGFDFILGSHLYKKENAFLAVDWKFRFLAGENNAHDHRINTDDTFSNIRYAFFDYDLELGLTLNRLRERTRIVLTGFAGAGITHGRTFTDLYDSDANLYDYSVIDPNQSRAQVYADLLTLSDRDYETPLSNKAAILPTAGIYLGYQFSRSFSIGIEHKINFSLNENNSIFGIDIDNNILAGSRLDMNHYTSLGFRWSMGGRSSGRTSRNRYSSVSTVSKSTIPVNTVRPVTDPVPIVTIAPPAVNITVPSGNSYTTTTGTINITAIVKNLRSRQYIQVLLNGNSMSFEYNPGSGIVRSLLILNEGTNTVVVSARNDAGSARDNVSVVFNKPVRISPPAIRFLNPPNPVTVDQNVFPIKVQTTNVGAWGDVKVSVNGIGTTNFSLSREGVVTTNIGLKEGLNRIEVSGKNESGMVTESATITYNKAVKAIPPVIAEPCIPPVLRMIVPLQPAITTDNQNMTFRAEVGNISNRNQLVLTLNGRRITNFILSGKELQFSAFLDEGSNALVLEARNDCGSKRLNASITFVDPVITEPCIPPVIRMIVPSQQSITTDNQNLIFRAEVGNISNRDQLVLTLNGRRITNFILSGKELQFSASLNSGINNFVLVAKNDCGTESVNSSITFVAPVVEEPCIPPAVSLNLVAVNMEDATHELRGIINNVNNRSNITLTVNGARNEGFQYQPATGELTAKFKFNPGTYTIAVNVKNECGSDVSSSTVTVEEPCLPPKVNFSIKVITSGDANHELKGTVTNVTSRSEIAVSINGSNYTDFQYTAGTGEFSARFVLNPGTSTIVITAKNSCGQDSGSEQVVVKELVEEEKPCGVRINPGNSAWQFCLVTPRGTFNRENLTNPAFNYSGQASSLYFSPIAGGGDAIVKGKSFSLKPGQYYLFTGNLTVTVSTKNQGSMGKWSVCIISDKAPVFGNGNNRPKSPCEEVDAGKSQGTRKVKQ